MPPWREYGSGPRLTCPVGRQTTGHAQTGHDHGSDRALPRRPEPATTDADASGAPPNGRGRRPPAPRGRRQTSRPRRQCLSRVGAGLRQFRHPQRPADGAIRVGRAWSHWPCPFPAPSIAVVAPLPDWWSGRGRDGVQHVTAARRDRPVARSGGMLAMTRRTTAVWCWRLGY